MSAEGEKKDWLQTFHETTALLEATAHRLEAVVRDLEFTLGRTPLVEFLSALIKPLAEQAKEHSQATSQVLALIVQHAKESSENVFYGTLIGSLMQTTDPETRKRLESLTRAARAGVSHDDR